MRRLDFFMMLALVISFGLGLLAWQSVKELAAVREDYDATTNELENLHLLMEGLQEKNNSLASLNFSELQSDSDFSVAVVNKLEENNLNLLAMNSNNSLLSLKLQGGYYSFAGVLADWKKIFPPCRLTSLKIIRDPIAPEFFIEADLTLEVWQK
ncbi:MAG: hypothetical protein IJR94_01730 [Synergistaceae bacterium]|nr:hypothetical protein [Synergistaceae bacterium]